MILVLLRHTPNPSSKFIDLDVEIPCARGTFDQFESTLYGPSEVPLCFLLVALGLASAFTMGAALGRPVTDPQNDVAVEYLSARSPPFAMTFAR